ncbi:DUF3784 domain-containing protein [uncultured Trichococcus sp.]|uniref:DUF3784 domain-containing protein n=1 Tax=uncultured Trichococcus sp. TaxID=189665 RepID=UPI002A18E0B5|nr:DUF3784 domain-containing protein [uncultured Trichococcus sp.]
MIFFFPTVMLLIVGWLIKYKKVTWLISGYNTAPREEKQKYDIEKLCKYMGNFIFVLASIFFVMAITSLLFNKNVDTITRFGFGVLIIVTVSGIVYLNTNNRVKK